MTIHTESRVAATSLGTVGRGTLAVTRLRRGSMRIRIPPRWPSCCSPELTQTAVSVAATPMKPASDSPSEILATTLLLAGSIRHTEPGTATGTQTAPAPKATPAGPESSAAIGMLASTRSFDGSTRVSRSPDAIHSEPAPNASPCAKPLSLTLPTTAERCG
jgi:hypothetical protein